jgi:hypothetical protein
MVFASCVLICTYDLAQIIEALRKNLARARDVYVGEHPVDVQKGAVGV